MREGRQATRDRMRGGVASFCRALGTAVLLTGVAACVSPEQMGWLQRTGDPAYVLVKSAPTGATVSFPDGTVCETPCRVGVVDPLQMTVARIGYAPQTRTLTKATPTPLLITLEPVGRSTPIEEVSLPDL